MPRVTLHPAIPDDQPALHRLMQLYLYDFSEFSEVPIDDDGLLGHREFIEEQFGPAHDVYLIRANGDLAGFAIVTRGSYLAHDPAVTDLTQFFVLRAWRKRGVGASAAMQVFALYPGPWELRVIDPNTNAHAFWEKIITRYTQNKFTESHYEGARHKGPVFTFTTPTRA